MNENNMTLNINKNRGVYYQTNGPNEYIDPFSRSLAWGPPMCPKEQTSQNLEQLNSYFKPITGCPGYYPIVLTNFEQQNKMNSILERRQFPNKSTCVSYNSYDKLGYTKPKIPSNIGNQQHNIDGNTVTYKQPLANELNDQPNHDIKHFEQVNYQNKQINVACNGSKLIQITDTNRVVLNNPTLLPDQENKTTNKSCSYNTHQNIHLGKGSFKGYVQNVSTENNLMNLDKPLTFCTKEVELSKPEMGCASQFDDSPSYREMFNNSSLVKYMNPYEYRSPATYNFNQNTHSMTCSDNMTFDKCPSFSSKTPCVMKYMPGLCENLWNNSTKRKIIGSNYCQGNSTSLQK